MKRFFHSELSSCARTPELSARARTGAILPVLLCALYCVLSFAAPAAAQDSSSLASKSIAQVYSVNRVVFALAGDEPTFTRLDPFPATAQLTTGTWPYEGIAEGGAAWSDSLRASANLLLRSNYWISDSQRVARVTSLRFNGTRRGGDSLIFRDRIGADSGSTIADAARLTAMAIRDENVGSQPARAVLGFGRLGLATLTLQPSSSASLFADTILNFIAFPTDSSEARPVLACRWNRLCGADTLSGLPPLDSVIAVAIDSSHADSLWLLVATQKGLRRGLWRDGSLSFPYVTIPNAAPSGTRVRSVFTAPDRALAWIFTESRFFFSDDHGATWRVPPDVAGVPSTLQPATLSSSSPDRPMHAAFYGDSTFINFNFDSLGLVVFRRDTMLTNTGTGIGQILLNAEDGLGISQGEGALTTMTVVRGLDPTEAVLVAGSTLKGVFYRRLDRDEDFTNINRLKSLKGSLGEVITYPTLFTVSKNCGDEFVRVGYRIKKDAKVTITVYNYAMEKVKTIVKNAPRRGGIARSESLADDRWDGCDESGRFVSVGTYYILVESSEGEKAFGKALVTRGRK